MVEDEPVAAKERIAELEREVAQLRARLEPLAPSGTGAADDGDGFPAAEPGESLAPPTNWTRVVVLSALLVTITLGVMFSIFRAISSGIQTVAPRAASVFAPSDDAGPRSSPKPPLPAPPDKSLPQVPGL